MDWDEEDEYEEYTFFIGPCTCECESEDHSWGSCDNLLDGGQVCDCEAGWEE